MMVEQSAGSLVGVTAAKGFLAGGLSCGIKAKEGAPDLALLLSELPATAAGVVYAEPGGGGSGAAVPGAYRCRLCLRRGGQQR